MPVFEKSREIVQAIKLRKSLILYLRKMSTLRKIKYQIKNDASFH